MDKFKLPKNWDEVFVDQFLAIRKLDESDYSFYYKQLEILAILTDTLIDDEIWEDLDSDELSNYIKELNWLRKEPFNQIKNTIGEYQIIDINMLSFGEFIDLEHYFTNNYYENLSNICSVLYRKTKKDDWGNTIIEPYSSININERVKEFSELKITEVYGVINYYLSFKTLLITTYAKLFEPNFDDEDEIDEEEYTAEEKIEIEKEKTIIKWSWENILYKLSDGDITKYEKITNFSVIFIFNQLSFLRDVN